MPWGTARIQHPTPCCSETTSLQEQPQVWLIITDSSKKKPQRIDGGRESASLGEFVKIGRKKKSHFLYRQSRQHACFPLSTKMKVLCLLGFLIKGNQALKESLTQSNPNRQSFELLTRTPLRGPAASPRGEHQFPNAFYPLSHHSDSVGFPPGRLIVFFQPKFPSTLPNRHKIQKACVQVSTRSGFAYSAKYPLTGFSD